MINKPVKIKANESTDEWRLIYIYIYTLYRYNQLGYAMFQSLLQFWREIANEQGHATISTVGPLSLTNKLLTNTSSLYDF